MKDNVCSNKNILVPDNNHWFGLCGLGAYLTVLAELGTDPWTVFHMGIGNYIPLTIGQASQVFGLIVIILSLPLGIKPGIGTILNMFFMVSFMIYGINWVFCPGPITAGAVFVPIVWDSGAWCRPGSLHQRRPWCRAPGRPYPRPAQAF